MLTSNIKFINFIQKQKKKPIYNFKQLKKENWIKKYKLLLSLTPNYKYSYTKAQIKNLKKQNFFRLIGMGGSTLGAKAIYKFLQDKTKKKFVFIDNLKPKLSKYEKSNEAVNIIISKSGNTLETIINTSILINQNQKSKNIFITEKKNSYLLNLAHKIRAEVFEHKNYIGGRYSVLSEVGMLPAELMGFDERKFKRLNLLINNNNFLKKLIINVDATLKFIKQGKSNSIILNYDEKSENLLKWYQQLIAESLGKKSKGLLPMISNMPMDNHSLLQLYLDGPKKNFYTFFNVFEKKSEIINKKNILNTHAYLKNKSIFQILNSQKKATENIFKKRKLPFRSFELLRRNEETLGELFCFFILETILLGRALKVNSFDQPSVELVKKETKKILI
ncbi:MAG TPA: glucose-6-phosphate isomerase [Candidatus Pelagibacter sp.]|jgi:glucose-6-phosphate isomerase|nr:glucose-6-phosphate isomerase [Candidatus Pelagibacter sp.]|tara:strand:- start:981 stop:2153 length:1173 start_codon:yes stop_codon:yes gene_type:complete